MLLINMNLKPYDQLRRVSGLRMDPTVSVEDLKHKSIYISH